MKIDKQLQQQLANLGRMGSVMNGGSAPSNVQVRPTAEGIEVRVSVPGLGADHYYIDLHGHQLAIYASYGPETAPAGGASRRPVNAQLIPLPPQVDLDSIDAVYEQGTLRIWLPFLPKGEQVKRRIHIRTRHQY
jgi:HSP20 family molecular chaperone IbpA